MHKYGYIIFPGHSCLRLEMGRYQFFCKIDTISKKVNLVSVYSWQRRQVGLYNKRVPNGEFLSVRFYRAMHYSAKRGIEIACRLSVTLLDQEHIGWKSWKLIAWTISPTPSLFVRSKANKRRLKITEKTERGRIQGLPKFMRCSQLAQERYGRNIRRFTPSKSHKNFGDKGASAYPGTAQFFA